MKTNLCISIFISAVAPVTSKTTTTSRRVTSTTKECPVPTYGQKYNVQHFPIPFKSLIIFGDSYSDVGNTYTLTNGTGISPWSFGGSRYSDGRVWNEYMAQYFNMSLPMPSSTSNPNPNNYAWGGATTNNNYIPSESSYANVAVPGVNDQVDTYIQDQQRRRKRSENNDKPHEEKEKLFCLYSGYNDYWWYVYRDFETTKGQQLDLIEVSNHVVNDIITNVAKLYEGKFVEKLLFQNTEHLKYYIVD